MSSTAIHLTLYTGTVQVFLTPGNNRLLSFENVQKILHSELQLNVLWMEG
jgi:hypothetical protein